MTTEKRLIDANRLLRDPYFIEDRYPESHLLRMAIGEQHTVDAVEVVHGWCKESEDKDEWYSTYFSCSECNAKFMLCDSKDNDISPSFCPNCGAKMDGERRPNAQA